MSEMVLATAIRDSWFGKENDNGPRFCAISTGDDVGTALKNHAGKNDIEMLWFRSDQNAHSHIVWKLHFEKCLAKTCLILATCDSDIDKDLREFYDSIALRTSKIIMYSDAVKLKPVPSMRGMYKDYLNKEKK